VPAAAPSAISVPTAAPSSETGPVRGGTLTYGTGTPPLLGYIPGMAWSYSQAPQIDSMFLRLVYGRQFVEGMEPPIDGPLEMGVAQSMVEIEPDRVWEFELRQDVFWHDGEPVTADDVILGIWMSINKDLNPRGPSAAGIMGTTRLQSEGGGSEIFVEGATKLGDYAIRIELEEPILNYWKFYDTGYYPMPYHLLSDNPAKAMEQPFATEPVGNGAFKVVRFVEGQFLELEANEDFYLGRPYLDKLIFRIAPDADTLTIAMEAQEIDGMFTGIPTAAQYGRMTQLPYVMGTSVLMASPHGFKVNNVRFPEQHAALQKAIAHALDVNTLNREFYLGTAVEHNYKLYHSVGLETPPSGYPTPEYNPDKARQILQEANWDTNQELEWLAWYQPWAFHDAIAAMLAEVGIKTTFRRIDSATVVQELYVDSNWDIIWTSSSGTSDMETMWREFQCGSVYEEGGSNNSGYCNPEIDALWQQGIDESDPERRKELFAQAMLLMADDPYMTVIFSPNVTHVWNTRVNGAFPFHHFQAIRPPLERVWVMPQA